MTCEEVKKVFFKYDGSLFAMAMEEKEVYENYKLLNISEETVEKWRQELLKFVWNLVKVQTSDEKIKLRLERNIKKCYLISSKINYSTFPI